MQTNVKVTCCRLCKMSAMKISINACGTIIIHTTSMFNYNFSGIHVEKFSKPNVGTMQIRN